MEKLTSDLLEDKLKSTGYVIIDFSSPGCAPCKKVPPVLKEIIDEVDTADISAYEVNVVDEPQIAKKYFVLGVPTIIVFKNGEEIKRFNSIPRKEKLKSLIK